ncbi:MAG: hypothetical protein AB7I59_06120 [Geminicoccaceae bacterium]
MTVALVAVILGMVAVFGIALGMRSMHHRIWFDPDTLLAAAAPPAGHDPAIHRRFESVGP